ncbi:glycosyltransferase [Lacihabitans sp. LS3-19]|uniref:glycosyltransferase n=1 Tax=Lacihabitans sp. LS3-19 TaxID=2487335 RepID=UPI0020CD6A67|nr:glycosyltransferase [Lacihabitans sp. LS3-19]MCP9769864.1 glycosyltransferase [Lacihabitans sp. LS3-19]
MSSIKVSILIPARNEEKVLPLLFESLNALDFPRDSFEILFGNDASADKTGELIESFAINKPWIKVLHINESKSVLKGKTRVLAELAKMAKGDYLFFTDADIVLPKTWLSGMLSEFENDAETGVVVGVTAMKTNNLKSAMQSLEWLIVLSINKLLSDRNIPTTGMGNNMAVSKKAYDAVGGYEKIGFSIVEDYNLYKNIIDKRFGFRQAFKNEVLAYTLPPSNFFEQRRRWIQGAIENNPGPMYLGVLQALALPIYIILFYFSPLWAFTLFGFSNLVYFGFTMFFESKLKIKGYLKFIPIFSIYLPVAWLAQFMYYFFTKKAIWKGREY